MKFISWNCRGLGNPRAVRELGELIRTSHPDFVFLVETLVNSSKIEELRVKFVF